MSRSAGGARGEHKYSGGMHTEMDPAILCLYTTNSFGCVKAEGEGWSKKAGTDGALVKKKSILYDVNPDMHQATVQKQWWSFSSKTFRLILKKHFTAQRQYSLGSQISFKVCPLSLQNLYNVRFWTIPMKIIELGHLRCWIPRKSRVFAQVCDDWPSLAGGWDPDVWCVSAARLEEGTWVY